ncbi:MAG: hypothetical protein HC880_01815 [Bacteroidia bacterium]|nr:hypothetical protein [Bacteroidia bacterium]
MMKSKFLFIFPVLMLCSAISWAQPGWKWGEDPQRAKEKYTLFGDDLNMKNFEAAKAPFYWLLTNTPDLNEALYIKGVDLYQGLLKATTDDVQKDVYQDSILTLYDLRIKNFGNESEVLNRKGYYALAYWQDRPEKFTDLFDLYKKL